LKILITGVSGLIGSATQTHFQRRGHQVVGLTRDSTAADNTRLFHWDPLSGNLDPKALSGVDGVINLAGENIAEGRWTERKKNSLVQSRIKSTELLVKTILSSSSPPSWMVNASAVGIYGDCGDEIVHESSTAATDFLGNLALDWEGALGPLTSSSTRTISLRFGLVLSKNGGALKKMLPIFKLGGGAVLGSGKQWVSWVSLDDVTRCLEMLATNTNLSGPVNCTSPHPVRFSTFAKTLARVVRRPVFFKIPSIAVRILFGEMGNATLLASCRANPAKLLESGFKFEDPLIEPTFRRLING